MKIGFIGAGRVGYSLGRYLKDNGFDVIGYYSINAKDSAGAMRFTNTECYGSINEIVDLCDTLFLTVNDDSLNDLVDELIALKVKNKNLIHTSGAKSSLIFKDLRLSNNCYSLHPIYAFNDKYEAYKGLANVSFTIEGNNDTKIIKELFKNNKIIEINANDKIKYHTACVFLSNYVNAVTYVGLDMLRDIGNFDIELFKPLILDNVNNIIKNNPKNSLTGPVKRNDINTINMHLNNIDPKYKNLYIELANVLINMQDNINDYDKLKELLEEKK